MKRMMDSDWSADVQRYDMRRPFLKEQSIWAVWTYRLGRRIDSRASGGIKRVLTAVYLSLIHI